MSAGALREELNQSLKTAFERNGKVLGIWLAFEPNGLDGKDSEFVNDAARQSNEAGRFATYWSRAGGDALNTIMVEEDMTKTTLNLSGTPYNSLVHLPSGQQAHLPARPVCRYRWRQGNVDDHHFRAAAGGWQVHRRGRYRHRPRRPASGGGRLPA